MLSDATGVPRRSSWVIRNLNCEILDSWRLSPRQDARESTERGDAWTIWLTSIYTSGSSGQPKAVAMPHRGLVNHSLAASSVYGITETDRRLQMASIGTDVFVAEIFNYLCRGAALVFGWDRGNKSVREFLQCLDDRRITISGIPSAWWSEWMAAVEESGAAPPACLRAVIIGMEKADPASFLEVEKAGRKQDPTVQRLRSDRDEPHRHDLRSRNLTVGSRLVRSHRQASRQHERLRSR